MVGTYSTAQMQHDIHTHAWTRVPIMCKLVDLHKQITVFYYSLPGKPHYFPVKSKRSKFYQGHRKHFVNGQASLVHQCLVMNKAHPLHKGILL